MRLIISCYYKSFSWSFYHSIPTCPSTSSPTASYCYFLLSYCPIVYHKSGWTCCRKDIFPSKICSCHFLAQNSSIAPRWIQGKDVTLLQGRWLATCAVSGLTTSTCFGTEHSVALCAICNLCTFTFWFKSMP